jgi:hypothetical protein
MSDKLTSFKDFQLLTENFKNFIETEETEYDDAVLDDGTPVCAACAAACAACAACAGDTDDSNIDPRSGRIVRGNRP